MIIYDSKITPIDKGYGTCSECYVELRIYPGPIDIEQINNLLKIDPTKKSIEGPSIINSYGRIREVKISSWFLCSQLYVESKDLRSHVDWLSSKLHNSIDGLKKLQSTNGVKMTLACVWRSLYGDGGPMLWPKQIKAIADLDLECCFEMFYNTDSHQLC